MNVLKCVLWILFLVIVTCGLFNVIFWATGYYFGPFYESDADQNRNVAIWLFGNLGLIVFSVVLGTLLYRRHLRKMP
ncbi:hypothetical protein NUH87_11755 [Pseudomonas batumici]|uniref:hypothetical protein n=1 Tax=Pseudomonas batumici TaxID=226910 RepID=UPI0030D020EC